jgi:hypothetical protein
MQQEAETEILHTTRKSTDQEKVEGPDFDPLGVDIFTFFNSSLSTHEEEEKEEAEDDGVWSSSSVESTSRLMVAMLRSTTGDHDQALKFLKVLP